MSTLKIFRSVFVVAVISLLVVPLGAQTVNMRLEFQDYDVMFLSDFIDVTTQKLAPNIPNIYLELRTDVPIRVYLTVEAFVQLKGESQEPVFTVNPRTKAFDLSGTRIVSSRDFSESSTSDIQIEKGYVENTALKTKLENYAKRFPTAPVGTYQIIMKAYTAGTTQQIGAASRTIEIRNASVGEVQVTLIDPQEGATLLTTLPTFSWNSEKPNVTLYIYEKLAIHRSPQEAVQGIPHLKVDLSGISTYTYPPTAQRRLEENKGYYWYVETSVSTNRGIEKRQSEIRFFRVVPASTGGDAASNPYVVFLQRLGETDESLRTAVNRLIAAEWQPSGAVLVDGRRITQEEFVQLVNNLVQTNTKIQAKVEDR